MLRSMLILLFIWAVLLFLATSCATTGEYDGGVVKYGHNCTTRIELRNGTKFEYPIDMDNLVHAEQGCVNHYGEDYCLTRFIKTGQQSYWAICGRSK